MHEKNMLAVRRWSTADVEPSRSLEYYAAAARHALAPMSVACKARGRFHATIEATSLGPLELLRMFGGAHSVTRGKPEILRSERRLYSLVINRLAPWRLVQRGCVQMRPGDAILIDTALPSELTVGTYELINITMTEGFVRQWVPDPVALTTHRLARDGRWSSALAAFASQLTPEFANGACPLPAEVITQQLGVLLMLSAGAGEIGIAKTDTADAALHQRIVDELRERLDEVDLTAERIAESLGVPERRVHIGLAAQGRTFATLLLRLRLSRAGLLSASPSGSKLTTSEIARLTGFKDGRSLTGAIRNRSDVLQAGGDGGWR